MFLRHLFSFYTFNILLIGVLSAQSISLSTTTSLDEIVTNLNNPLSITVEVSGGPSSITSNSFITRIGAQPMDSTFNFVSNNVYQFDITKAAIESVLGSSISQEVTITVIVLDTDGVTEIGNFNIPTITIDFIPPTISSAEIYIENESKYTTGDSIRLNITFSEILSSNSNINATLFGETYSLQENSGTNVWFADITVPSGVTAASDVSVSGGTDIAGNSFVTETVTLTGAGLDVDLPTLTVKPKLKITELNYETPEFIEVLVFDSEVNPTQLMYSDDAFTKGISAVGNSVVSPNEVFVIVRESNLSDFQTQFSGYTGLIFTTNIALNNSGDSASLEYNGENIDSFSYNSTVSDGNSFHIDLERSVSEGPHSVGAVNVSLPFTYSVREVVNTIYSSESVQLESACDISPTSISSKEEVTFTFNSDGSKTCSVVGVDSISLRSVPIMFEFEIDTETVQTEEPEEQEEPEEKSNTGVTENEPTVKSVGSHRVRKSKGTNLRIEDKKSIVLFNKRIFYPDEIKGIYYLGDKNIEIGVLQSFLIRQKLLKRHSYINNVYDDETARAVIAYKKMYKGAILSPTNFSEPTNVFDSIIREHVNQKREEEFDNIIRNILWIHILILQERLNR